MCTRPQCPTRPPSRCAAWCETSATQPSPGSWTRPAPTRSCAGGWSSCCATSGDLEPFSVGQRQPEFFALAAAALAPYALLGVLGCGVLSLAGYRLATQGWGGLDRGGEDLRPAVVLFGLVTAGTVVAVISVRRQVRATQALEARLRRSTVPSPSDVAAAAERARLTGRVAMVDDPDLFSLTYGLLAPRVVVSRGLVAALGPDELDAVLHHERYHVRNWDTLKVIVARAAPAAFFFLPRWRTSGTAT